MHELKRSARFLRGALGTAVTWAVLWGVGGVGIGVMSVLTPFLPWDRFFAVFDAPLPALAVPGFVGGLLFSAVLRVAARRRPLSQLSARQFAWWGATGGFLVALVPDLMLFTGVAYRPEGATVLLQLAAIIAAPLVAMGSLTAVASVQLAKRFPDPLPLEEHQEPLALTETVEPTHRSGARSR